MAKDTIHFSLEGDVSLDAFRVAIDSLTRVVEMLTNQADPEAKISWIVKELKGGSVLIEVRGAAATRESDAVVEEVVENYNEIGRRAAARDYRLWTDYPRAMRDEIATLSGMLNGAIPRGRIGESMIDAPVEVDPPDDVAAHTVKRQRTSIKGKIVTLDNKRATYFTLREAGTGRSVRCWPESTQALKKQLADLWRSGMWVLVEGFYNTFTDKPTLTDITEIFPLGAGEKGAWRKAFGSSPRGPGDSTLSVPDLVRKVRDGE